MLDDLNATFYHVLGLRYGNLYSTNCTQARPGAAQKQTDPSWSSQSLMSESGWWPCSFLAIRPTLSLVQEMWGRIDATHQGNYIWNDKYKEVILYTLDLSRKIWFCLVKMEVSEINSLTLGTVWILMLILLWEAYKVEWDLVFAQIPSIHRGCPYLKLWPLCLQPFNISNQICLWNSAGVRFDTHLTITTSLFVC